MVEWKEAERKFTQAFMVFEVCKSFHMNLNNSFETILRKANINAPMSESMLENKKETNLMRKPKNQFGMLN